jgi:acetyltransferase-like isoleucine patch superfamily enzyme
MNGFIHHLAHVDPWARVDDTVVIGAGCKVWQFASVIRGTVLGIDCTVAATAVLDGPALGDRCIVSPGVDIGPGFEIGDDVFLGPHVVLCNDYWPRTHKRGFDYEALRSGKVVSVRVHSGASIGAGAKIMPGVTIGMGAMIASNAVVKENVPAKCLWTRDGDVRAIRDEDMIQRVRAC